VLKVFGGGLRSLAISPFGADGSVSVLLGFLPLEQQGVRRCCHRMSTGRWRWAVHSHCWRFFLRMLLDRVARVLLGSELLDNMPSWVLGSNHPGGHG
jgi:hypothetical protein